MGFDVADLQEAKVLLAELLSIEVGFIQSAKAGWALPTPTIDSLTRL
jgi:hypothetical protein